MSEIGWLHLTDLHIGNSSAQALLPNVKAEFFEDISWLHEQSGPWSMSCSSRATLLIVGISRGVPVAR